MLGKRKCCCAPPATCLECNPCCIPQHDLHTTINGGMTLHYNPGFLLGHTAGIKWHTDCFAPSGTTNAWLVFGCDAFGNTYCALDQYFTPGPPSTPAPCTQAFSTSTPGNAATVYSLLVLDPSFSCNPLSLPWGFGIDPDEFPAFYVTDPGGASVGPATPVDLALQRHVEKHGGCC